MLRRLRRKLRLIRYYSATQRSSAWTRAIDTALVITLLSAYPTTWLIDTTVVRSHQRLTASGMLARDDRGAFTARGDDDLSWLIDNPDLRQAGRFTITVDERRHGWPLATSVRHQPARVDLDLLSQPAPWPNADLAPDDPLRIAIEQELVRTERVGILDAWTRDDPTAGRSVRWAVAAVSGLMWWVILFMVAATAIQLARAVHTTRRRRAQQREHDRLGSGHCASCGYDLRGLEFSERCPECGGLV